MLSYPPLRIFNPLTGYGSNVYSAEFQSGIINHGTRTFWPACGRQAGFLPAKAKIVTKQ